MKTRPCSVAPREHRCSSGVEAFSLVTAAPISSSAMALSYHPHFPKEDSVSAILLIPMMPPPAQIWRRRLAVTWMRRCSGVHRWLKRAWYRTWALLCCSKSAAGCGRTNHPMKRTVSRRWQNVDNFKNWIMGVWDPLCPSLLCIFLKFYDT